MSRLPIIPFLLGFILFPSSFIFAQRPTLKVEGAKTKVDEFDEAFRVLEGKHKEATAKLSDTYDHEIEKLRIELTDSLAILLDKETKSGNLDEAIAIRDAIRFYKEFDPRRTSSPKPSDATMRRENASLRSEIEALKSRLSSVEAENKRLHVTSEKFVFIASSTSGKVIGVSGGSTKPGADVIQGEPKDAALHTEINWEFIPTKDGWFYIINRKSGQALGIVAGKKADGARVMQWPLFPDCLDHQWRMVSVGPSSVMIENRNSSKFLSLQAVSDENGVKLVQLPKAIDSRHQIWQVLPAK